MLKSLDKPAFFVINVSDRNVCLSDLALTIPAGRCFDLLNDNFNYTIGQLKASLKDGSLHKKRDKIKIGGGRPVLSAAPRKQISENPIITRPRSAVKLKEIVYDELIFSDEEYAYQMAEDEE